MAKLEILVHKSLEKVRTRMQVSGLCVGGTTARGNKERCLLQLALTSNKWEKSTRLPGIEMGGVSGSGIRGKDSDGGHDLTALAGRGDAQHEQGVVCNRA